MVNPKKAQVDAALSKRKHTDADKEYDQAHNDENAVPPSAQLFVSLDLVNSTSFKARTEKWPVALDRFYVKAEEALVSDGQFQVWKHVGDEVLFRLHIRSPEEILSAILETYNKMNDVKAKLDALCAEDEDFPSGVLDVKGTVWIACVRFESGNERQNDSQNDWSAIPNISRQVGGQHHIGARDFLGPHIDEGFRVASHADKRKLAISATLMGVLRQTAKGNAELANFQVVEYARLKGIWGGLPYPIIWYHHDWKHIANTFLYFEQLEPELNDLGDFKGKRSVRNVGNEKNEKLTRQLDAALVHNEVDESVKQILSAINDAQMFPNHPLDKRRQSPRAEVHVAAIVLNRRGDKVLLSKRKENKEQLKGKWEFGCGQLVQGVSPVEQLKKEYQADYGLEIEVIGETPVGAYLFPRSVEKIPGYLYLAIAQESRKNPPISRKHSEVKWHTSNQLKALNLQDCVPDLHKNISIAQRRYKELRPPKTKQEPQSQ
ncbi:NUDIX domain-containing protein [Magnetofaba australis]|uniref:Nudix hydrolase domain-containing protein n=1 Tax=Magnetofaba australis IT-1 TaxID=1434232 RepID=A0A1Y2K8B8_9PROT|nr:NUDIX domain-containing protein [Magnetofaba australis]OSM06747.1 hypothetical protein MAIT1_00400 [Magnetofaba australis IT-1]